MPKPTEPEPVPFSYFPPPIPPGTFRCRGCYFEADWFYSDVHRRGFPLHGGFEKTNVKKDLEDLI